MSARNKKKQPEVAPVTSASSPAAPLPAPAAPLRQPMPPASGSDGSAATHLSAGPAVPFWFMPAAMLFIVLAALLAYSNSFVADFSLDNALVILQDIRLRAWAPENLRLVFRENYWWPSFPSELYRPLTTITYLFNWSVLGNEGRPAGYHVVNYLIHCANALMVLIIARRLTGRPWLALLAAAIFVLHPVEVESVTNVVGRADELCTLWILVGFWCYIRSTASAGVPRVAWLIGLGLAAGLGMFSKESGIMIVCLLPLYDYIYRWPKLTGSLVQRWRAAAYEFGLKGYIAVVPAVITFFVVRKMLFVASPIYGELFIDNPIARPLNHIPVGLLDKFTSWSYGELTAFKVLGRYLGLLLWPATLSCDYSYNQVPLYGDGVSAWEDAQCWLSLVLVGTLIFLAFRWRKTYPLFAFGVLFFFGMLMPTANIIKPIGSIMAERFLYLPSIGFCLVAAVGLRALGQWVADRLAPPGWRAWAGLLVPLLIFTALGARTYARNKDWRSEFSLWASAVKAAPNSFKVYKGMSNGWWNSNRNERGIDLAIAEAEKGLKVIDRVPLSIERQDNTLFCDLGMYYNIKGDFLMQRAQQALMKAAEADSSRPPMLALGTPTSNPTGDLYRAEANALAAEAATFYQKGVDTMLRAREVDTWVNGAARKAQLGRGRKAEDIADVGNPRVHTQLAASYLGLRNWAEAAKSAGYAVHLAPLQQQGHYLLAVAFASAGQLDDAAVVLIRLLMLQGTNPNAYSLLAQIYEKLGQNPVPVYEAEVSGKGKLWQINGSNPLVRAHIIRASAGMVQLLLDAKQRTDAAQFRSRAIASADKGGFGVPAELLPEVPYVAEIPPSKQSWWQRWIGL